MATETRTITIDADSELGQALNDAGETRIILVQGEKRYLVTADPDDPWANYDPEKVGVVLRQFANMLTPEEGERMKENIYRGREEGTRPFEPS